MPDILILSFNNKDGFELEELAKLHGFRTKLVFDFKSALDWSKLRAFDLALVQSNLSIEEQQQLAGNLWKLNSFCCFVVYSFDQMLEVQRNEVKLLGAELAVGKDAKASIEKLIVGMKTNSTKKDENLRVLVVEDLDSPRDIICFYLESLGVEKVIGVGSAKQAMSMLENDPTQFTCVITDIRMPEISGEKLIEHIRLHQKLNHIPVIALTAYGTVDCLIDCLKAGASGFLVKPPKRDDLTRELARAQRIAAGIASPRLAVPGEADQLRKILIDKGFS